MAITFNCSVITPSGPAFEGAATYVTFPAWDGQYGVLPRMAPVLGRLGTGTCRIETEGGTKTMTLDGGFAHVHRDGVTLLTESVDG